MTKSKKFIRLSVSLLLLVTMLITPFSPVFAVVIDSMDGDTDLTAADIVSEDASKREQFSRHYLTGDGTYFAVSYAEAVNYQDEDGNWIPVDNSLSTNILTGEKSTRNEKFKVKFANKANKDDLVSIQTEDYKVSFGITVSEDGENYLSLSKVKGTESASNTSAEPKTTQEATSLGKAVSGITYKNAFSDYLDVRYTVAHEKVKEDIILQKKSDFNSYKATYNIKEKDALATLNEDGSITFTSHAGEILFKVGAPVMYDAEGKPSADIAVSMVQTEKTVEITYTPNAEWLNADDRGYPVIIDPENTMEEYDSNIIDLCFYALDMNSISTSSQYLSVGMDYYDYIQFDYIPTLSEDDTLSGASLVLQGNYLNDWGSTAPCSATLAAPTVAWDEDSFGYGEGQYDYYEIPISSRHTLNNLTFEYNNNEIKPHYLLELSLHGFFTSVSEYTTFFNSTYGFEVIMCYDYEFRAYASEHPDGYYPALVVRYNAGAWNTQIPGDITDIDFEERRLCNYWTNEYVTYANNFVSMSDYEKNNVNQKIRFDYSPLENAHSMIITDGTQYMYYYIDEADALTYNVHTTIVFPDDPKYESWKIYYFEEYYEKYYIIESVANEFYVLTDIDGVLYVTPYDINNQHQRWYIELYNSQIINTQGSQINLDRGDRIQLKPIVSAISYTSSDTTVATVSSNGIVNAIGAGTAQININVGNNTIISVYINVSAPSNTYITDTAILMTVTSDLTDSFNAHAYSVSQSLSYKFLNNKILNPHLNYYEIDEVLWYLCIANVMVISAHGGIDEISLNLNSTHCLVPENFEYMDLSHIELLVLLCCSNAEGSSGVVTRDMIEQNGGPRNIFEYFVNCGVQTVVAFNDEIDVDVSSDYIEEFFGVLYDVPRTNAGYESTPNYTVEQAISVANSNYPSMATKVVIGGNEDNVLRNQEDEE